MIRDRSWTRWSIAAVLALATVGLLREPAVGQPAPATPEGSPEALSVCLVGFSKDLCNGRIGGGTWRIRQCDRPGATPCSTLIGLGVPLTLHVQPSQDRCDTSGPATAPCDQTPDLRGPLQANLFVRVGLQGPCAVRGCFSGSFTWSHDTLPVVIARGRMSGTLGVGTHRGGVCPDPTGAPAPCGPQCEGCHTAVFDPSAGVWRIHVEGSLAGTILAGPHRGCRIWATLQGVLEAPGRPDGPAPPDAAGLRWRFCGTADGVLECVCR